MVDDIHVEHGFESRTQSTKLASTASTEPVQVVAALASMKNETLGQRQIRQAQSPSRLGVGQARRNRSIRSHLLQHSPRRQSPHPIQSLGPSVLRVLW